MENINYVTQEALDKMKTELQHMKGAGRAAIAKAIAEAREKGDLKENAEYDAAKEAQGIYEAKIVALEHAIVSAQVVKKEHIDTSQVSVLTRVTVLNEKNNKENSYTLVSHSEADVKQGKISVDAPIGRGLLGKKEGARVEIDTPAGKIPFKILKISVD